MINYEEDARQNVSASDLKNITSLAGSVVRCEAEVERVELELKKARAQLKQVQERDLPEAMLACNMETFTTSDGLSVSVKETLYASIAKKNKAEAIQWLMNNELGALVKEDIVVAFDSGQRESVKSVIDILKGAGVTNFSTDETVNTTSVKSAIKELLGDGKEVPLELFGAYFARKAVVK